MVTRRIQENWDFKATERQENDCSSGGTTFEGIRVPKGSSSVRKTSGYKPRCHQKSLRMTHARKWSDWHRRRKLKFPLCPGLSKRWRTKSETFQHNSVECSNSSKASGEEPRLFNDLNNHENQIFIFFDNKTVTVDTVFNKRND